MLYPALGIWSFGHSFGFRISGFGFPFVVNASFPLDQGALLLGLDELQYLTPPLPGQRPFAQAEADPRLLTGYIFHPRVFHGNVDFKFIGHQLFGMLRIDCRFFAALAGHGGNRVIYPWRTD